MPDADGKARPVDIAKQLAEALIERLDGATGAEIEIPVIAFDHVRAVIRVRLEA